MVDTELRVSVFECHFDVACDCRRTEPDLCIRKFETAAWARQCDVKRLATEGIQNWLSISLRDTGNINSRLPVLYIQVDVDRHV